MKICWDSRDSPEWRLLISPIQSGFANVGSMVVYEKGKPKRSDYRKFKMKTVAGRMITPACMRVLTRRFQHGLDEKQEMQEQEHG